MEIVIIESRAYQDLVSRIESIAAYIQRQTQTAMEKNEDHAERLLTTREVIARLGVSNRTLQRIRNEGRIRYVIIRGSCRYPAREIERIGNEGIAGIPPVMQDQELSNSDLRTNRKYSQRHGNVR